MTWHAWKRQGEGRPDETPILYSRDRAKEVHFSARSVPPPRMLLATSRCRVLDELNIPAHPVHPPTMSPIPRQESSQRCRSCSSGARGGSWAKPRAAVRLAPPGGG